MAGGAQRWHPVSTMKPLAIFGAVGLVAGLGACAGDGPGGALREHAPEGFHVGASFVERNEDPEFRQVLTREFDSTTAPIYWTLVHPEPDVWDFAWPDEAVALAEEHGMRVRGHPILWGRLGLPAYVRAMTDPDALREALRELVTAIVERYRGRIAQYDVVNEPITFRGAAEDTDGLADNVFLQLHGADYVGETLRLVRELDPDAALYVNEFGVLEPGEKQDRFHALLVDLLASGAPLDGVGIQGHVTPPYWRDYAPSRDQVEAAVRRFAALGLDVEITEVDVTLDDPRSREALRGQRQTYRELFGACLAVERCTGITVWGVTDRHTWIRELFAADGAPLLFDEDYRPKPAHGGVLEALIGAPSR